MFPVTRRYGSGISCRGAPFQKTGLHRRRHAEFGYLIQLHFRRRYVYQPLKGGEFRLLRGTRRQDGSLHGELRNFPGQSLDTPAFNAISYTWGPLKFRNSIEVGGSRLPLPDSLYPFLAAVLENDTEAWWWADSICINQKDDFEKSQQVPMMGEIFGSANTTYAWLGEQSEDSDQAMAFLQFLGGDFWREFEGQSPAYSTPWFRMLASRSGENRHKWMAVERLFQRPWWRRVWTVQEYIVSEDFVFRCGSKTISGAVFRKALLAIWSCHRASGAFRYDAQWNRNRILEYHALHFPGPSLTSLLAYLGDHFSTDPRDRLYSLLGLVRDPELIGSPDYDVPVTAVYTKLVKSFVDKYRSLDIICFATSFKDSGVSESIHACPTWVPDWRVPATPLVVPLMVSQGAREHIGNLRPYWARKHTACYSASHDRTPRVSFSQDDREMQCYGISLDYIDGLSGVSNWMAPRTEEQRQNDALVQPESLKFTHPEDFSSGHAQMCTDVIKSIMRCLVLNRRDHYLNHPAPEARFVNELRSLFDSTSIGGNAKHTHFTAWFHANRKFEVKGLALATLFKQAFSGRVASAHELPEPFEHSAQTERQMFASRFHDTVVKMERRPVVTERGLVAMAPRRSTKGDIICIIYGCSVPVVLRKDAETDQYRFIGECYVDGYMNGEALSGECKFEERLFALL